MTIFRILIMKKDLKLNSRYICLEKKDFLHSRNYTADTFCWREGLISDILLAEGLTLNCCHSLLTGNYNFYDACNVEWNCKHISLKVKDSFHHFCNISRHEINLLVHLSKKKGILILYSYRAWHFIAVTIYC